MLIFMGKVKKTVSLIILLFLVMRLGKKKEKEKETENKNQQVEGVTRLICSAKTHTLPLKGYLLNYVYNVCLSIVTDKLNAFVSHFQ